MNIILMPDGTWKDAERCCVQEVSDLLAEEGSRMVTIPDSDDGIACMQTKCIDPECVSRGGKSPCQARVFFDAFIHGF